MERLKKILRALFFLPDWLALLVTVPAFALVIDVLAHGETNTSRAYASYGLSAYALIVMLVHIPGVIRAFRTDFVDHPLIHRVLGSRQGQKIRYDRLYRAQLLLHQGLFASLLYAAVKAGFGLAYRSVWFGILAAYYLLLSLMRLLLVRYVRRTPVGQDIRAEWRSYRLCGFVLLAMNQALAAVVYLIQRSSKGFVYPGVLIYVMAAYTFYSFVIAIVNMARFRRYNSPVMSAAKAVNLVSALVSVLSLETAMLTQFAGEQDQLFCQIMTGLTGIAICAAVLALAVYMIIQSTRALRALKQ
ncbi:MAG: hypothetical protein IJ313_06975 [Clostridia bacterium]|nr:hypothetical protein [Clostridia bacterium]